MLNYKRKGLFKEQHSKL